MRATITLDASRWKAAAIALKRESSRSIVDFTNGQALFVASNAIKFTKKAIRQSIERQLGVVSSREKLRGGTAGAKGWVRITKRTLREDSYAARIVAARFRKTGRWMIRGATLEEKAINLIAAKVRSVAFIRSGWIAAVKLLSAIVYKKPRLLRGAIAEIGQTKNPKGWVRPATFSLNGIIECVIANTALISESKYSTWHGKKGNPIPIAKAGLRQALDFAAANMEKELARRLKEDLSRFGVR